MARKKGNKQLLYLVLALAVVLLAWLFLPGGNAAPAAQDAYAETTIAKEGSEAPDFTVNTLDGSSVTLSSLKGKVVLLNFWATWCPPCREELKRVQADIVDRFAGRDFVFLPVSRGEESAVVGKFMADNGYTFAVGLDPEQAIYKLYASNYIPRNFLIDKEGKVVLASIGYEPEEFDSMICTIEKTLE